MDKVYNSVIEALIFASDESISAAEILKAIKEIDGEDISLSTEDIDNCINELNEKYNAQDMSINIMKIAHG
jgi:segregation and condensation protein B